MSIQNGIRKATYKVTLNNENNAFAIACGHLYQFLYINDNHDRSREYKATLLTMHLEIDGSPVIAGHEEQNIELQLKEEIKALKCALQAKDDVVNRLMNRIKKLEKDTSLIEIPDDDSNVIDEKRVNDLPSSSNANAKRQSLSQLDATFKARQEDNALEKQKPQSQQSQSQFSICQHSSNATEKDQFTADFMRYRTTAYINQKRTFFTVDNLISIQIFNPNFMITLLDEVLTLANNTMAYSLKRHQISRIDARMKFPKTIIYDVFFHSCRTKNAFLQQSQLQVNTDTNNFTIRNYEYRYDILIKNLKCSALSLETAMLIVISLARLLDLHITCRDIECLDVFQGHENTFAIEIRFAYGHIATDFRNRKHFLKKYEVIMDLEIY
ncbi:hypothetical protein DOY81_011361 [Sarcophaga bullata]|nr:hypothetical protein DOY81_011361 [Sarcophaga bullata]